MLDERSPRVGAGPGTREVDRWRPAASGRHRRRGALLQHLSLVVTAVALRVPLLGLPERPDEAGYLLVAARAHPGGPFLFGSLWVDRPPLLIGFSSVADALGGVTALRSLRCCPSRCWSRPPSTPGGR